MDRSCRLAAVMLGILTLTAVSNAQMMRNGPPQFHGVLNPVIGQGAVYQLQGSDGKKTELEIAILGKDSVEGKDAYWMQMAMSNSDIGGQMVIKHLLVLDGQETHTTKTIMQFPGRPPMEMPAQMAHREHSSQATDVRSDAQDLGSESLTVPAGTYATEHYRAKDGTDIWVAKDVPPWGLVKSVGKDSTMVLLKVVPEAKDKIVGTPQPFNPMMMGQRPEQQ